MSGVTGRDQAAGPAKVRGGSSAAWLLAQVGAHAAGRFAERLAAIDLAPPHAGILRAIAAAGGINQQSLAGLLAIHPSRLVALMDELEKRGLVERRSHAGDRRSYALYLTPQGEAALEAIGRIAREHQEALCAALSGDERHVLAGLLRRIAEEQGLRPGVHPGFREPGAGEAAPQGRKRRPPAR